MGDFVRSAQEVAREERERERGRGRVGSKGGKQAKRAARAGTSATARARLARDASGRAVRQAAPLFSRAALFTLHRRAFCKPVNRRRLARAPEQGWVHSRAHTGSSRLRHSRSTHSGPFLECTDPLRQANKASPGGSIEEGVSAREAIPRACSCARPRSSAATRRGSGGRCRTVDAPAPSPPTVTEPGNAYPQAGKAAAQVWRDRTRFEGAYSHSPPPKREAS